MLDRRLFYPPAAAVDTLRVLELFGLPGVTPLSMPLLDDEGWSPSLRLLILYDCTEAIFKVQISNYSS
jgi:hypothetical protein